MENVAKKSTHPLIIIASIAIILFCVAGVAAIMGWIPKSGADADVPSVDAKTVHQAKPQAHATTGSSRALQTSQAPANAKTICKECGVVQSVREVEKQGEGTGLGAVAGGVVGGVVGHQIGSGRGNDVATVVGAVGGAVAGHQIEKHVK